MVKHLQLKCRAKTIQGPSQKLIMSTSDVDDKLLIIMPIIKLCYCCSCTIIMQFSTALKSPRSENIRIIPATLSTASVLFD